MKLEVIGGCFGYDAGHPILKDVSFALDAGQVLCLLGPNGSGKTTLIRCAAGLARWTAGKTLLDGEDIAAMKPRQVFRRIGVVPQARPSQLACTAEEMVLLGRGARLGTLRQPGRRDVTVARECLAAVEAAHLAHRPVHRVSGGELQLILIARALAAEPELLVLDEPEAGLDLRNQALIMRTILRLRRERGLSFLISTHRPDHALALSDQAALLPGDGTVRVGAPRDIITEEALQSAFGVTARILETQIDHQAIPTLAVKI